jgi:hypothetical protein
LYLNELLQASCLSPFRPAELFKFAPDELVSENMAAPGKLLLRCSTIGAPHRYIPVGDLDRSPLIHSYGYESARDRATLFAIFPLLFVPFMHYVG